MLTPGTLMNTLEMGLNRDPFVALHHWLDAVEQTPGDKTLLICLGEFERIDEIVTATGSLSISCLEKEDAVELIRRPVEDFLDIWPEEAVDHLNRKKAKTVLVSEVEEILPAAFQHRHYYFDEFWHALPADQSALLSALAQEQPVPIEFNAAAPLLLRKEILTQENGDWAFRVPLIGQWIAEKKRA